MAVISAAALVKTPVLATLPAAANPIVLTEF
jgi:hypothetical protein